MAARSRRCRARRAFPPGCDAAAPDAAQIGDRLSDETGEWEVVNRPHATAGGKVAHARVRRDQPAVVEERTWGAHERVEVKRGRA